MKLYIPKLKEELKLTSDWTFKLHYEHRNASLYPNYNNYNYRDNLSPVQYTLTVGTILKVDRYYIRNGASDFDSMTFRISYNDNKDLIGKRFWVKLDDANKIEFESVVYNTHVSMRWDGYIRSIYPAKGLSHKTEINNQKFVCNELKCKQLNEVRFVIKKEFYEYEATEENWKKYEYDKREFFSPYTTPRSKCFDSLDEFFKTTIYPKFGMFSKPNISDYILYKVKYSLYDNKTGMEHIAESVDTLKTIARKILKNEIKT